MEGVVKSKVDSASVSEIMTVIGVVTILVVMIIPLPSILLDFLLALNITVAITILLIAMYNCWFGGLKSVTQGALYLKTNNTKPLH